MFKVQRIGFDLSKSQTKTEGETSVFIDHFIGFAFASAADVGSTCLKMSVQRPRGCLNFP